MENTRYNIGQRVVRTSILINVLLTLFKLLAGFLARSTAMVADAVHSASDILTTLIVAFGLRIAQKPEDPEHPYGHEKAESISAKFVAGFLLLAGITIGWKAIENLIGKTIEKPGILALYAAGISIVTKESLYWYTTIAANKINSTALKADAWHHRSDVFSSIGTLVGIGAARLGYPAADPIAAIVVSLLIIKVAYDIYAKSISELMDSSAPPEKIQAIRQVISLVQDVKGIDLLKTRMHGNMIYVDVDIVVDRSISVLAGHDIANEVRNVVMSKLEYVKDVMVHVNPCAPFSPESACKHCDKACQDNKN
jgi:cation diffusion facilitator family transporter